MADAIRRALRLVGHTQALLEHTQMIIADSRKRRYHTSMAMRLSRTMRRERAFARLGR